MSSIEFSSPHMHVDANVAKAMRRVIYALLPALAAQVYFFTWGTLINVILAVLVALACEAAMLRLRKRSLRPYLLDGSVIVTAMLLAMAIPPLSPWWMTTLGTAFAVIVGKHLYGGLGYNPFNPAMLGYVLLLISFPLEMTSWLAPRQLLDFNLGFSGAFSAVFTGTISPNIAVDAVTMASPLDTLKTQLQLSLSVDEIIDAPTFGTLGGRGWEWVDLALFAGGIALIYMRVITWHIPTAMLGALIVVALPFNLYDPGQFPSPMFHLFSGATMLGAFFIATDPVSASTTTVGRLVFGAGIGILVFIIRTWGGYPDGVAFAVLIMNMAAPTIDYYTRPRVFGHGAGDP